MTCQILQTLICTGYAQSNHVILSKTSVPPLYSALIAICILLDYYILGRLVELEDLAPKDLQLHLFHQLLTLMFLIRLGIIGFLFALFC